MDAFYNEERFRFPSRQLTAEDWSILNSYKSVLKGIVLVYGSNCVASLHSAENRTFPCIAVENGEIDNIFVGTPLSGFPADALTDESRPDGKDVIGLYYARTASDHALKTIISVIRNDNRDLVGALCISIDVSVPLHVFMRSYIPVVDNDLASSISETTTSIPTVMEMIEQSVEQAKVYANKYPSISSADYNRLIVRQLNNSGIFEIRGAVNIVAQELKVSRYSIYNYLKDASKE